MPLLRQRSALLVGTLLAAASPRLAAQLPPLTVPKGLLRVELGGRFDNWDKMYIGGVKQDAAGDFIRDPVTSAWLPGLAATEAGLRKVTGMQAISLSLGKSSANMLVNVGTESLGLAYGVTRRLTLFGHVPLVRVRVQNVISLDSTDATAGFNPGHPVFGTPEGATQANGFLEQLGGTLGTLTTQLASGAYDNDPARKALAEAALVRGVELEADLNELLSESAFLPLLGSPAAAALLNSLDSLRNRLTAVNITGFVSSPPLPTHGIPLSGLADYATNENGPVAVQPFEPPIIRAIGDIEVGAAFAWLDHRPPNGFAVRSVLTGTVRLRTGKLDEPDALLDLPTGDRQPDIQGDLVTDLGVGRLGARVTARYVLQLPGRQARRVTPPDQPIALAATLAAVERNPGEIVEGALEPYVRIAPYFSVVAGIRHWAKGADRYQYIPNQDPIAGTSIDVLAQGSKENGTALSLALSLAHSGMRSNGRQGMPVDAQLRGEIVVGSSLGRVPVKQSVSLMLRLYRKIF